MTVGKCRSKCTIVLYMIILGQLPTPSSPRDVSVHKASSNQIHHHPQAHTSPRAHTRTHTYTHAHTHTHTHTHTHNIAPLSQYLIYMYISVTRFNPFFHIHSNTHIYKHMHT